MKHFRLTISYYSKKEALITRVYQVVAESEEEALTLAKSLHEDLAYLSVEFIKDIKLKHYDNRAETQG